MTRNLVVDGMLSGTGIRDESDGYISPSDLQISHDLVVEFKSWLLEYENAHYYEFSDKKMVEELDRRGMKLARAMARERPDVNVRYFSHARLTGIPI